MFSYKFNNDFGSFKVEFPEQWERFHYCNAAIWYGGPKFFDKFNCRGEKITQDTWILVSYSTPIAIATQYLDFHKHAPSQWFLRINEDAWNCSPSTIRQLARFLAEIKFPHYSGSSPYQLVKRIMRRMEHDEVTTWHTNSGNLNIYAETSHAMGLIIHSDLNIPTYYVRSI